MKLLIGDKLRLYRRQRELTQEDVAAALGVTYQAISKWERNEGYPDIEMLPSIANYFGITVDELIGMNELASKARYEEINALWLETHQKAKADSDDALHRKNIELMRSALKTYPGDQLLLVQLSSSLERLSGTAEEKLENLRASVLLQEEILRGEDSEVRSATLYNICFAYRELGLEEKALAAAEKLPNLYKARENALVRLWGGEDKNRCARSALEALDVVLGLHLRALAETEENGEYLEKYEAVSRILKSC